MPFFDWFIFSVSVIVSKLHQRKLTSSNLTCLLDWPNELKLTANEQLNGFYHLNIRKKKRKKTHYWVWNLFIVTLCECEWVCVCVFNILCVHMWSSIFKRKANKFLRTSSIRNCHQCTYITQLKRTIREKRHSNSNEKYRCS